MEMPFPPSPTYHSLFSVISNTLFFVKGGEGEEGRRYEGRDRQDAKINDNGGRGGEEEEEKEEEEERKLQPHRQPEDNDDEVERGGDIRDKSIRAADK